MNEHEAIVRAKEIINQKEIYVILSAKQANLIHGISIPFIGVTDEGKKVLYLFNTYDKAKKFVEKQKNVIGDVYPIAKLDNNKNGYSLVDTLKIAKSLGITGFDYNIMESDVFGADIAWFLKVNGISDGELTILLSKEEMNNPKDIGIRFNPLKIVNYTDEYKIEDVRKEELLKLIFNAGDTVGDYKKSYLALTTIENLFLLDTVTTKYIPSAIQENKKQDMSYFRQVELILQEVVWGKLRKEQALYTAIDPETQKPLIKNGCLYVFITDKYENMGHYKYEKLESRNDILRMIEEVGGEKVIVTDGPRYLGIIPVETINKINIFS
ncbi:MAG: hypothetical protein IJJ59_14490 [Pseudobutyrivibrio sp.]|uniref:hypothetical protein n=1 Tax=Pseudobutyrivibrio sp. TaxID=2014367 RepID=UPI0025EF1A4C|nr:hypothetical protein [Pseudobutyrivibrio sp.]MBQ6464532.1 hypothetical protein [Pseudobutyrivibrio sp.]